MQLKINHRTGIICKCFGSTNFYSCILRLCSNFHDVSSLIKYYQVQIFRLKKKNPLYHLKNLQEVSIRYITLIQRINLI